MNSLGASNRGAMLKAEFGLLHCLPFWSRSATGAEMSSPLPKSEYVPESCSPPPASNNALMRTTPYLASSQSALSGDGDPEQAYHQSAFLESLMRGVTA